MLMSGYWRFADGGVVPIEYGDFCFYHANKNQVFDPVEESWACYMTGAELAAAITKMMRKETP